MRFTTGRAYAGAADLRRMEELLASAYASTSLRVGDLSWLSREHTHRELSLDIRLWEDASGRLIAWTYFRPNGEFNVFVAPDSVHVEDSALFDELLEFVEVAARASVAAGDPPLTLNTYSVDTSRSALDRSLAAALERFGYQADHSESSGVLAGSLDRLPEGPLQDGYHLDWVRTPRLLIGRVEAHRAAFAPSDLSVRKYERLQRTWAYRPQLDRLVVTDAEEVVAFCTAWLDEDNASGLLEPVGTDPAHQRRGLARAVCLDACRALQAAGARHAQVGFASPAGFATYASLGFQLQGHEVCFYKAWPST
jgi:ribosomal protein S18 acetylase RimI-like enzyme